MWVRFSGIRSAFGDVIKLFLVIKFKKVTSYFYILKCEKQVFFSSQENHKVKILKCFYVG